MPSIDSAISSVVDAKAAQVQSQATFAVAAKGLEAQKAFGEAAVELIDSAKQLSKAPGLGGNFDGVA